MYIKDSKKGFKYSVKCSIEITQVSYSYVVSGMNFKDNFLWAVNDYFVDRRTRR